RLMIAPNARPKSLNSRPTDVPPRPMPTHSSGNMRWAVSAITNTGTRTSAACTSNISSTQILPGRHVRVPVLVIAETAHRIFPEECVGIGLGGTSVGLEFSDFGRAFGAIMSRRRRRTEFAGRCQNPWLPGRGHRQDRVRPGPPARPHRYAASPLGIRSVCLASLDDPGDDAMTDFKTGGDIAWIADSGEQP